VKINLNRLESRPKDCLFKRALTQSSYCIISAPENHPKSVVFYCAVGWRASIMADQFMTELAKPEYHDIRSNIDLSILEGSMFKWGNERRDMIGGKDDSKTNKVHGVSGTFEKMLHEDVRASR